MAARKSLTALVADTDLSTAEALDAVRAATDLVGERGVGKVEGRWQKGNNRILIDEDTATYLTLKVAMDERQKGNLSFPAVAEASEQGHTTLTVGGLLTHQVMQTKLLGFIPIGPGTIIHFGFYRQFLDRVREDLLKRDPNAQVKIGIYDD
jgi:hypothetical protein